MSSAKSYCLNCENEFDKSDKFCGHCGQNRKNYNLEIKEISSQVFISIFNLDSTFFRSFHLLATPWKLTKNFVAGKRIPYYHPGRMFIVLLFLLFSVLTIFKKMDALKDIQIGEDYFLSAEDFSLKDSLDELAVNMTLSQKEMENVYTKIFKNKIVPNDTMIFEPFVVFNSNLEDNPILLKDILTLSPDTIFKNYNIVGFWGKLFLGQSIKFYKNNHDFIFYFIKNILWIIPFTIIIVAGFMMILYFRNKYYYIEHLTFLMHLHASIFAFFILLILLTNLLSFINSNLIQTLIFVFTFGIFFLSLIKYYGQNLFKTLIKFIAVLMVYSVTLIVGLILILLISVFLF